MVGEIDRVMMGNALRHPCHGGEGGEWDTLRQVPRRSLRRLTGARMLTPEGLPPDVAATHYIGPATGNDDTCAAVDWYVRTALLELDERRRQAHRRRHDSLARRNGHRTYFDYRDQQARAAGYRSLYHMRTVRGAA